MPAVYIMTNKNKTVLYTGVTNNLERRVQEHKNGKGSIFATRYKCTFLVYYCMTERVYDAIVEEKRIKAGSRMAKVELIESINPEWSDLACHLNEIASYNSQ